MSEADSEPLRLLAIDAGESVAAGPFRRWLTDMGRALAGTADMDVPCGSCNACCRSRRFVHLAPDETEARAHVPAELLFPAPGRPGHHVLGYDERGRCPMLGDHGCSIHPYRPRACRTYDCRVFAAAGLDPAADDCPDVGARAARWRFDYEDADARRLHAAIAASARALEQAARSSGNRPPVVELALRAVRRHGSAAVGVEPRS